MFAERSKPPFFFLFFFSTHCFQPTPSLHLNGPSLAVFLFFPFSFSSSLFSPLLFSSLPSRFLLSSFFSLHTKPSIRGHHPLHLVYHNRILPSLSTLPIDKYIRPFFTTSSSNHLPSTTLFSFFYSLHLRTFYFLASFVELIHSLIHYFLFNKRKPQDDKNSRNDRRPEVFNCGGGRWCCWQICHDPALSSRPVRSHPLPLHLQKMKRAAERGSAPV